MVSHVSFAERASLWSLFSLDLCQGWEYCSSWQTRLNGCVCLSLLQITNRRRDDCSFTRDGSKPLSPSLASAHMYSGDKSSQKRFTQFGNCLDAPPPPPRPLCAGVHVSIPYPAELAATRATFIYLSRVWLHWGDFICAWVCSRYKSCTVLYCTVRVRVVPTNASLKL